MGEEPDNICTYDENFLLADAGLFISNEPSTALEAQEQVFEGNNISIKFDLEKRNIGSLITGYSLTPAGFEIAKIAEVDPSDVHTLKYFVEMIHSRHPDLVKRVAAYSLDCQKGDKPLFEYVPPCNK